MKNKEKKTVDHVVSDPGVLGLSEPKPGATSAYLYGDSIIEEELRMPSQQGNGSKSCRRAYMAVHDRWRVMDESTQRRSTWASHSKCGIYCYSST